jgi:hypothetical protein
MNGRQASLAGHRFRAVIDPRIRDRDCGDAAASDEPRSAEGGVGLVDTVRPRRGCDQIESDGQSGAGGKPAHARPLDGRALCLVASPTGRVETYEAGTEATYKLPLHGTIQRAA